ncbi:MAG: bifunctional uridylyltransferase/uridylyl-removing protein, partial [Alphaproteobacteria bacterium]|nr:bifunctional uridylyltransferase/uridylyl-removing protein [Alphaproteobacteria bacterium]
MVNRSAPEPIEISPLLSAARAAAAGDADMAIRRQAVVAILRQTLAEGRQNAERLLNEGRNGIECVTALSSVMDEIIGALFEVATNIFYPSANPSFAEKMSIAAVGGYGRGTLAPGSDIDLLILLPYKATPWSESVIEIILYALWDLKLKVGHSVRTVEECIREGKADMTIRTALLEARLLTGNAGLFSEFQKRYELEIVSGTAAEFVAAKLAEREARVSRAGSSRYLVEPNVKDGKGGLRDLNTLFWIAKYVYQVRDVNDLVDVGLFSKEERQLFLRCEEFLWRVRSQLHFVTNRSEERLSFDIQPIIAQRLGYASHGGLSAV